MKLPFRLFELIQDKIQTNIYKDSGLKSKSKAHVNEIEVKESIITFKTHPQESLIVQSNSTILAPQNSISLPSQENSENLNGLNGNENQQSLSINDSSNSSKENQQEVKLTQFLEELDTFDEAMHVLNLEGEKQGLQFKKGNIQYYSDGKAKYKQIICSWGSRHQKKEKRIPESIEKENKKTESESDSDSDCNSDDKIESKTQCKVFYRWKLGKDGKMALKTYNEKHSNHEFKIKKTDLNAEMIKEISNFNKLSKVIEIKAFLENKFKVKLIYSVVYNEFRRIFPLLGPNDANNFIDWCKSHNFSTIPHIDNSNKFYTRLFISSILMQNHYKCYGDIVIIDSTYSVNRYKLPVTILSGFTHTGRICIFGVAIINEETKDTFEWILNQFFAVHGDHPKIIVSDHDLALESVLDSKFPNITHVLCSWHMSQSFNKNFGYLNSMSLNSLKLKLMNLISLEKKEEFETIYKEAIKIFENRKLNKSKAYLERMYQCKEKWSRANFKGDFSGGIHTTSRAESINSLIKKYVNSNCEISDFIKFLQDFEKKSIVEQYKEEAAQNYITHPLIIELQKKIFGNIFDKHLEQFTLSHNYTIKFLRQTPNKITYEAKSTNAKSHNKFREVSVLNKEYDCNCETFTRDGFICRHIFSLSIVNQDKNLDKFNINSRWLVPKILENVISNKSSLNFSKDNFDFNTNLIKHYLKEEENIDENEQKKKTVFIEKKREKGAPKKEKRILGNLEKPNNKSKLFSTFLFL